MQPEIDPDVSERLLAFFEHTDDLVGVVDEQSRVLYLNPAARKRLGVGAATDLTTADVFPPSAFHRYYEEIRPQTRTFVQPVVDMRTGEVVGYQGLARWNHPERGLLPAAAFIDLVADAPIAPVVDLAVLRDTARVAAATPPGTKRGMRAYGHLSRRLLGDLDPDQCLGEITREAALANAQLFVEIAQPVVMRRSPNLRRTLESLREAGVHLVLSDVDREYGVHDIVEHGFHELRLSRRLVTGAVSDAACRRVVRGTAGLARGLGLSVVAVGVENARQRDEMLDAGCDLALGHFFGPAVAAADAFVRPAR